MNVQEIKSVLQLLSIAIAAGVFGLLLTVTLTCRPQKLLLQTYEEVSRNLKKSRNGLLDYQRLQAFLLRNGADIHFGKWIGPVSYTGIRLVLGGIGLLLGSLHGIGTGLFLTVVFFLIPDALLIRLNHRDNERMLPELKLVYHAISMQLKAGVYVTDALAECYGSVQEGRLRRALLALSGDIVMKSDAQEALEGFQEKFDNSYVDALCIIIMQALESGQAVDLLSDIAEQIKDMEVTLMNRKKSSLDRSITFYQLGILSAILVIVLYACVTHMLQAAVSF